MITTHIHSHTGDVAEIQWSPTLVKKNPFSVQELLQKLWEKLRSWGPHTYPLITVLTEESPLFHAWPLESSSSMEEENKKIEFITGDDTPSPSLFVQLQIIYKVFADVVLEYNTVVSLLQMRCINEAEMWRKYTSRLKNELRQKNEERVAFIKRVSHI
ncbi:hypothetical protein LSM04_007697 [Trypanosoma melophagium]|uniref:uncharacterized protein n=1 Tax=Trypanosoma melophagium TaxID=715481 RepID=UPI00351AAF46|nr:hypothetical protein LSM04_007697 [Trypanosoma melophagium]